MDRPDSVTGAAAPVGSRSPRSPSVGTRVAGVEGLRALAAGSILAYHVWLSGDRHQTIPDLGYVSRDLLPHLAAGVTLFFTLSGFLLYRRVAHAIVRGEPVPRWRAYFENRALRILPAYWVALVVTGYLLRSVFVPAPAGRRIGGFAIDSLFPRCALFVQNFWRRTVGSGIGPAWSLVVEVVFYLVLPLLALLAAAIADRTTTRRGRVLAALAPAGLLLGLGLSGKVAAWSLVSGPGLSGWGNDWQSVVERSFWAHADLFSFGIALAVVCAELDARAVRLPRWSRPAALGAAIAVAAATAARLPNDLSQRGELGHFAYDTLMAVACVCLLAAVVLPVAGESRPPLGVRVLEARPVVFVGLVSYSLFLWHEPLIIWMQAHGLTGTGRRGFAGNLVLLGALSLAVASASYLLVERPALARRRRA